MDSAAIRIPLLLIFLTFPALNSHAEIYKWVDKYGKSHFTDKPPANQKTEEVRIKVNTYTSVEVKSLAERLGRKDKVVMYSAAWCHICKKAKKYFDANSIPYVSYDVEKSRTGKRDFKSLKGKSVPIIIIGDQRMNGFSVKRFNKAYQQYRERTARNENEGT